MNSLVEKKTLRILVFFQRECGGNNAQLIAENARLAAENKKLRNQITELFWS